MESTAESRSCASEEGSSTHSSSGRTHNRQSLINKINYINFVDGTISAVFRHSKYASTLSLPVKPLPCTDEQLTCLWTDTANLQKNLQNHEFLHLLIPDGQKALIVKPERAEITLQGLVLFLPQFASELNLRKIRRHSCRNVIVQLVQNGTFFQGGLIDFSAISLHVRITADPPKTFQWINPTIPVNVVLSTPELGTVYSGEFEVSSQSCGQHERSFILMMVDHQIRKFRPKKYRSARQSLIPSPNIFFTHPLTGQKVDMKVADISGTGFSVEEDRYNSLLLPGLIIPEVDIVFADGGNLCCKAQVIYRRGCEKPGKEKRVKCGIAILDMKIEGQVKLQAILNQVHNTHSYLSNQINLDSLWKFFFETGFIYPDKYASLQSKKELLRDTYQKIYNERPNIARHFVYQDNGHIFAHMAMIRFYKKAWLIHHHAAKKKEALRGGIVVLGHVSRYVNELHRLYSAHMDFVFCYFRPENRFPQRVFGGVAEAINNPKGCSIDKFAYFQFHNSFDLDWNIQATWSLARTRQEDLQELNRFLEHESGGLMIPALDLEPGSYSDGELAAEYEAIGLKRERQIYSLKIKDSLKAIVIANISDIGLNMSNLTNCFQIFVLDPADVSKEILSLMLSMLCVKLQIDQIPVLIYPSAFAENVNFLIEKEYNLWILNLQYSDNYFEFCKKFIPDL